MLRPLLFAPCEKVIIGSDNVSSLISIMEAYTVAVREELPVDASTPNVWFVVTFWNRTEEIEDVRNFEQRVDIIRPDGENIGSVLQAFEVSNAFLNFRNVTQVQGFPIGVAGMLNLRLSLREAGDSNEWREIADFPIRITHRVLEVHNEEQRNEPAEAG